MDEADHAAAMDRLYRRAGIKVARRRRERVVTMDEFRHIVGAPSKREQKITMDELKQRLQEKKAKRG